mgnify:CR=1 FL=1
MYLGVNANVSENIVKYREENGKFESRKEIMKVPKLGKVAFVQCAGFLKVPESTNVLDNTMVHPESYDVAKNIIESLGYKLGDLKKEKLPEIRVKLENLDIEEVSKKLNVGIPTLKDIVSELLKPGRDPREELPKPILKSDVLKIEDLNEGMILNGTVRNVTAFGAFVDIGIKGDGLVHISNLSNKFVRNAMDEVSVGDIVRVKVLKINKERGKVELSMKDVD